MTKTSLNLRSWTTRSETTGEQTLPLLRIPSDCCCSAGELGMMLDAGIRGGPACLG